MKLPEVHEAVIEATKAKLEVELELNPNNRLTILFNIKQENHALGKAIKKWIQKAEEEMKSIGNEIDSLYALCEVDENTLDQPLQELISELTNGLIVIYKSIQAQLEIDELEDADDWTDGVRYLHLPRRPNSGSSDL